MHEFKIGDRVVGSSGPATVYGISSNRVYVRYDSGQLADSDARLYRKVGKLAWLDALLVEAKCHPYTREDTIELLAQRIRDMAEIILRLDDWDEAPDDVQRLKALVTEWENNGNYSENK